MTPRTGLLVRIFSDMVAFNERSVTRAFADISTPHFPGIYEGGGGYNGPRPNPYTHPHLRLEDTMTSVPKVNPGDMVFWHCDVVHSVEREHTGSEDSAGSFLFFPSALDVDVECGWL